MVALPDSTRLGQLGVGQLTEFCGAVTDAQAGQLGPAAEVSYNGECHAFSALLDNAGDFTAYPIEDPRTALAVLQYTGGTTGVAKGAMLTHRNIVANMLQCRALMGSELGNGCETMVAPLPLYHIYAFTFHCMTMMLIGAHNVLITNPRDLPTFVKDLSKYRFTGFVGLNTLFVALCNNEDFRKLDFSSLKATFSGGMALQLAAAERWQQVTGCEICEGFGMTETSPVVSVNPFGGIQIGTIGIPMPSTLCKVIDDEGNDLPMGAIGELCVKGPQVMKGYWQRPDATADVLDAEDRKSTRLNSSHPSRARMPSGA